LNCAAVGGLRALPARHAAGAGPRGETRRRRLRACRHGGRRPPHL